MNLNRVCKLVRRDILNISYNAHIGHVGSALSVVEILTTLYFRVMKLKPKDPQWEKRDRFILSKGHSAAAYYSVLYRKGFISEKELNTFCKDGTRLLVHPEWNGLPGVEHGTGSLGHGLSVGVGMAYAGKLLNKDFNVYVLISDSEIEEGTTWEAALFAAHHKLDNLTVILDYNGTQAMGRVKEILDIEPLDKKWRSFNFDVKIANGHDIGVLEKALKVRIKKPRIVIAKTVIGKGFSFMENDFRWHYYDPKPEHLAAALKELSIK